MSDRGGGPGPRAWASDEPEPRDEGPGPFANLAGDADRDVWETLAAWRGEGRRFALLSVVETRGFTPRKAGAHMLLDESGATAGTVGGGAIEAEALKLAAARLAGEAGGMVLQRHLTRDLGMCCGGEMTVSVEVIEGRPRLFVFGGGYLARPIAALAEGCGFAVTVVDARPGWLTRERFPRATRDLRDPEDAARALASTAGDFAIVVTHDHALDQRLVQHLLRRPLRFLGMIGSLPKQRKFALRLRARGFTDDEIARLRTPLGLAIGAQTPEEIAVSVLAELVAVRRGATPARGWVPLAAEPAGPAEAPALEDAHRGDPS